MTTTVVLSRRELALMLLGAVGAAPLGIWQAAADDQRLIQIQLPVARGAQPDFDIFLTLCRIVLMRERLDSAVARQLYQLFLDEPWGAKHIATAYAALREVLIARKSRGGMDAVAKAKLPQGEIWFISHLATTWYVGVYYHPGRPTRWITLEHALMFDAARDIYPTRFRDNVGFGAWAAPPPKSQPK
jgi:hypothetical protein